MSNRRNQGAAGQRAARFPDGRRRQSSDRTYIEGNTVRQLSVVPIPKDRPDKRGRVQEPGREPDRHSKNNKNYSMPDRQRKARPKERPGQERRVKREQVRELHLGFGSVFILAVCAVMTLGVCVSYLKLQAENTRSVKNIAALENQLSDLITENDDAYNRLVSSIDLNDIREKAINELGMVYAGSDQVVLYDRQTNDYVRQYGEVPKEEKSLLDGLLGTRH